jgi:hypothetical protein
VYLAIAPCIKLLYNGKLKEETKYETLEIDRKLVTSPLRSDIERTMK